MNRKNSRIILTALALVVLACFPLPFVVAAFEGRWFEQMISHCFGVASLMCMALTCVISCRFPGVDLLFSGLDKAYVVHKWLGICALATLVVHDTFEAEIKSLPDQFGLHGLAEDMGSLVYDGLLILLAATFLHLIPYRWWRISHRLMIVAFIASLLHFILIPKPLPLSGIGGTYILVWGIAGVLAGLYSLRPQRVPAPKDYRIDRVTRIGGNLSLSLAPQDGQQGFAHRAGQFAFFRRAGEGRLDAHPFTISRSAQSDGCLQLTITPRSNWTKALYADAKQGDTLWVEGPHGRFVHRPTKARQIWLSGGIGITPFLAWADEATAPKGEVDILHVCRLASEVPDLDLLQGFAVAHPNVNLKIIETSTNGRPTSETLLRLMRDVPGHAAIWYCGPNGLRKSLDLAVDAAQKSRFTVHEEAFQIRGTLPLPKWIRRSIKTLWTDFQTTSWGQRVERLTSLRF